VSSVVANENDRPDRLVDGDLATAWSSATGELERTWIEVTLPADARVTRLELTAGYTREGGRRDLFTANVRIARVRVLRDGAEVGVYPLDPESRTLQPVPAQGAGGVWRIETVGLVPGTRRAWREVTVSELRVMGVVGATGRRATPTAPTVLVGPAAAAAAGAQGAAGDASGIERALTHARRELLGEGLNPEQGETGCSGGYADHCVRAHWITLADEGVGYAVARCGDAVAGPNRAYDRQRRVVDRAQARLSAAIERERDTDGPNARADEALEALMAAATEVFAACPNPGGLTAYGALLRQHDATALRGYRFRP